MPETDDPRLSRSRLLAGGAAAAAGMTLARAAAAAAGELGVAAATESSLELVFKVDHVGERMTAFGYLTHVAGLPLSALFSPAGEQSERTAHFTVHSVARLRTRSVLEAVRALSVAGPVNVYYRAKPGASFRYPDSFAEGVLVASYDGEFQSVVTVTAPRRGLENLAGTMRQTRAAAVPGAGRALGRPGLRLKLTATGTGRLLDPKAPHAVLGLAGSAVVA